MVEVEAELGVFFPGRYFLAHEKKTCNRNKFLFAGRIFFRKKDFFLCQLIRIIIFYENIIAILHFLLHLLQLFHMKSLSHPGQRLNSVILGEVSFLEKDGLK